MFGPKFVCTTCGSKKKPIHETKGSALIELILWLCFLIPGLIYSVWRRSGKAKLCPVCKNPTVIPANTPIGKKTLANLASK